MPHKLRVSGRLAEACIYQSFITVICVRLLCKLIWHHFFQNTCFFFIKITMYLYKTTWWREEANNEENKSCVDFGNVVVIDWL